MANTTNLNMVKPAGTDHALISVINSNMDIIDGAVGALPSGSTLQGEIDSANEAIGNITNYVDLGNMATQSALETALDTKLSSMGEFTNVTIRFLVTSSFAGFAANTYVGTLSKGGTSGSYAAALLESIIGTSKAIVKATKNTSWRFEELALKSEISIKKYTVPLNTSTPNSITVSGIGVFWVYGGTNGTTAYVTTETAQGNKTDTYTVAGSANLMIPVKDGQKMNYVGGPWAAASLYALEFPVVTV